MKTYIKSIAYYLPEYVLTNEELAKEFPEWSVEKIANKIGVEKRHIAAKEETALDMAVKAAERLFEENDIDRAQIDFVLLCTQSPDYFLPTSACIIQNQLGLSTNTGALDFNLGCSGFIYGLSLAKGLIIAGIARNVLLLTSETYSKYICLQDKGNRTIFGDAAAATLISNEGKAEIGEFALGTDGRGANNLIVKAGGARFHTGYAWQKSLGEKMLQSSDYLYMDGPEIFNFTIETIPDLVEKTLQKNDMTKEEVSYFIFHQANKYIINFLRKKLKIDENEFYMSMENVGNTVSSTIPIALYEANKQKKLQGRVLLAGFGVGYSWGGTVLTFVSSSIKE